MLETDGKRFRDLLRGMGRMYGQEPDGLVLDAYWLALGDWRYQDFEAAARHLMASAKFMPRPAEFNALRQAGEPLAGEAWTIVLDYCKNGFYRWEDGSATSGRLELPGFDEPTLKAVQALGGFHAIAMHDTDKLHFLEKRFAEHYEAMSNADAVRDALPEIAQPRTSLPRSDSGFTRLGAPLED